MILQRVRSFADGYSYSYKSAYVLELYHVPFTFYPACVKSCCFGMQILKSLDVCLIINPIL